MGRRRVRAALCAAAFLVCALSLSAGRCRASEDEDPRALLFSGRDIWRNGAFLHGGMLLAPAGFERDGLMLKLLLGGGLYRYVANNLSGETVYGIETVAQFMPGVRIKRGNAEFKYFFGLDWQRHKLVPHDPDNRLHGQNFGLRMSGELWYEPLPHALIAGDVSISSVGSSRSMRLAAGWRVLEELFTNGVYAGPEVQYFSSDNTYEQRRIGLHITSMRTDNTEWSAAGGYARDTDGRASLYLRLGLAQKITD